MRTREARDAICACFVFPSGMGTGSGSHRLKDAVPGGVASIPGPCTCSFTHRVSFPSDISHARFRRQDPILWRRDGTRSFPASQSSHIRFICRLQRNPASGTLFLRVPSIRCFSSTRSFCQVLQAVMYQINQFRSALGYEGQIAQKSSPRSFQFMLCNKFIRVPIVG